jgi:hypothetical protein
MRVYHGLIKINLTTERMKSRQKEAFPENAMSDALDWPQVAWKAAVSGN